MDEKYVLWALEGRKGWKIYATSDNFNAITEIYYACPYKRKMVVTVLAEEGETA